MDERIAAIRPMRGLLQGLTKLPLDAKLEVNFGTADRTLLVRLLDDAETTVNVIHLGVGAIGHLLAQSAVAIEDGSISSDCVEAIGFLIAELSDLAGQCMTLAAQCRRETAAANPLQSCKAAQSAQAATTSVPDCAFCTPSAASRRHG